MEQNYLKMIRNFYDLSQRDLAEKIGLSESYVNQIEHGKKPLTQGVKIKLFETLEIDADRLLRIITATNAYDAARQQVFDRMSTD